MKIVYNKQTPSMLCSLNEKSTIPSSLHDKRNDHIRHLGTILLPIRSILLSATIIIPKRSIKEQNRQKTCIKVWPHKATVQSRQCPTQTGEDFRHVMKMSRHFPPPIDK
mmetsp:Transcript_7068/g.13332  ORF Transcript_7068/g.13332 Transcript_7068/m.13332 type:complete len:109 (+) Transcript_7068:1785-2111(+)